MLFAAAVFWGAVQGPGPLVSLPFCRGSKIFTTRSLGDGRLAFCVQDGLEGKPRIVLTSAEAPSMKEMPLNDFAVSDDGKLCAYFATQADPRYEEIRLVEVATGKPVDDPVQWTHYGDFGWRPDGFYYGGYPKPAGPDSSYGAERVLFHCLGTPQERDAVVYADPAHPGRKYQFLTTFDHRFLMLHILERVNGQTLTSEWFRREGAIDGPFTPIIAEPAPGRTYLCDNVGDRLLVHTTYQSSEGRIVSIDTRHPDASHWKIVAPEPVAEGDMVQGRLVVLTPQGGRFYSADGHPEEPIPVAAGSTIELQACRTSDRYVFLSLDSGGKKSYYWTDKRMRRLHAFRSFVFGVSEQ